MLKHTFACDLQSWTKMFIDDSSVFSQLVDWLGSYQGGVLLFYSPFILLVDSLGDYCILPMYSRCKMLVFLFIHVHTCFTYQKGDQKKKKDEAIPFLHLFL